MTWLKQFREGEDGEPKLRVKSKSKIFKPTEDEQSILGAVVALVEERGEWEGRTSELLTTLEGNLSEDALGDWTPNNLGMLLTRATDWLLQNNVQADKRVTRDASIWSMKEK